MQDPKVIKALEEMQNNNNVRPAIDIFVERAENDEKSFFYLIQVNKCKVSEVDVNAARALMCTKLTNAVLSYEHAAVLAELLEDKNEKNKYIAEISRIKGLITHYCSM